MFLVEKTSSLDKITFAVRLSEKASKVDVCSATVCNSICEKTAYLSSGYFVAALFCSLLF